MYGEINKKVNFRQENFVGFIATPITKGNILTVYQIVKQPGTSLGVIKTKNTSIVVDATKLDDGNNVYAVKTKSGSTYYVQLIAEKDEHFIGNSIGFVATDLHKGSSFTLYQIVRAKGNTAKIKTIHVSSLTEKNQKDDGHNVFVAKTKTTNYYVQSIIGI